MEEDTKLTIKIMVVALMVWFVCCGCSRKVVYLPSETTSTSTDTLYIYKWAVDSVVMRDTISIEKLGDTIKITNVKWRERLKLRTDTLYNNKEVVKEVATPYPVEKTIEVNKLYWWQTFFMWVGIGTVAILVVAVALSAVIIWRNFR